MIPGRGVWCDGSYDRGAWYEHREALYDGL